MTCGIIEQLGSVLSRKKNAIFPIILAASRRGSTQGIYLRGAEGFPHLSRFSGVFSARGNSEGIVAGFPEW
jgi:hypothetical protein